MAPILDKKDNGGDGDKTRRMRNMGIAMTIPVHIAVCIGLPTWFGWWLDGKFSTSPWLLLICMFLGVATAFKQVVDMVRKMD